MDDIPPHTPEVEKDGDWFIASCHEYPGANGQGKSRAKAEESLAQAVLMIVEDGHQYEI